MYSKLRNWFTTNYKTIIRLSYIIPILFVAFVSISHVITWYSITNPISWAIYLSVGIEIAALSALAGLAVKNNKAIYLPFLIVTLIQLIGNMFFVFQYIDVTSKLFKDWVILMDPLFVMIGIVKSGDIDGHRRWLAVFAGALLPIISLSFLHLLVKFNDKDDDELKIETTDPIPFPGTPINDEPNSVSPEIDNVDYFDSPYNSYSGGEQEEESKYIDLIPEPSISDAILEPVTSGNEIEDNGVVISDDTTKEPVTSGNEIENANTTKKTNGINNLIQRIGSNKVIKDNNDKKIFFRRKA